jgi:hypothetical protein
MYICIFSHTLGCWELLWTLQVCGYLRHLACNSICAMQSLYILSEPGHLEVLTG